LTPMRKLISQVTELVKFTKGVAEMRQRGRRTKGMEEAHLFVGMTQINTNQAFCKPLDYSHVATMLVMV